MEKSFFGKKFFFKVLFSQNPTFDDQKVFWGKVFSSVFFTQPHFSRPKIFFWKKVSLKVLFPKPYFSQPKKKIEKKTRLVHPPKNPGNSQTCPKYQICNICIQLICFHTLNTTLNPKFMYLYEFEVGVPKISSRTSLTKKNRIQF